MQRSPITPTIACLLALVTQVPSVSAQEPASGADTTSAPGLRRIGIHAGLGPVLGGPIGVGGEYFLAASRLSATIGAGYWFPVDNPGAPGFGAAVRGFTKGSRHRGFLELSVVPLAIAWTEVFTPAGSQFTDVRLLYGPGLSVGYHYTAARGFTIIVGGGVGWTVTRAEAAPLFLLAFGHTWR